MYKSLIVKGLFSPDVLSRYVQISIPVGGVNINSQMMLIEPAEVPYFPSNFKSLGFQKIILSGLLGAALSVKLERSDFQRQFGSDFGATLNGSEWLGAMAISFRVSVVRSAVELGAIVQFYA